ncbi:MAG: ATP phosphoribosyltransferase, partial [Lentisphaerae bacterium]|nr:ATP phosphoribosyltransferase [Lentisphaerota bacterium]
AGFSVTLGSRSYLPGVDDPALDLRLIRAQEISRYVELGVLDAGITGYDWIVENGSDIVEIADLVYAKQGMRPVRWVVAVPEDSEITSIAQLSGKRIATEAVGLTRSFLQKHGIEADVEFSWGATEVKAPELVDAIVELTETGSSLRANNLRILATVLESTTRLIANKGAWQDDWKRTKLEQLSLLLAGALGAEGKVLLKMNIRGENVGEVTGILPALHAPTVGSLDDEGWVAVESVVDESVVREIIPRLKKVGAEGIIELPLNKIIP